MELQSTDHEYYYKRWKFNLNTPIEIIISGEQGSVIGRAEYLSACDSYLVRYAKDGKTFAERWIDADALEHVGLS